jgi:hypothetical protein
MSTAVITPLVISRAVATRRVAERIAVLDNAEARRRAAISKNYRGPLTRADLVVAMNRRFG